MATENHVLLTGMILDAPEIANINDIPQASFSLFTLRQARPTPAGEDDTDEIRVITRDASLVEQAKKLKQYDTVSILGTFNSIDVEKYFCCENEACTEYKKPVPYKGCLSYVNPIEIMPMQILPGNKPLKGTDDIALDKKLRLLNFREHSNSVRLIGRAIGKPKHVPLEVVNKKSKKKELLHLWQLRIATKRPMVVSGGLATHDHITVMSYNNISEISNNDFLSVRGFIKSKNYPKVRKCPCCQQEIKTNDYSLCVVPYDVEYIKEQGVK